MQRPEPPPQPDETGIPDAPERAPEVPTEDAVRNARKLTLVVYVLQFAGVLTALTPIIGVIINHVRRSDASGTIYASHFRWQIRTFWWSVLWFTLGALLVPLFGLGGIVLALAGIWYLYRAVRGVLSWYYHETVPVDDRSEATR